MIIFILAVPLFVWFVYKLFKDEFTSLRNIPKADGSLPILGHALTFLREKKPFEVVAGLE